MTVWDIPYFLNLYALTTLCFAVFQLASNSLLSATADGSCDVISSATKVLKTRMAIGTESTMGPQELTKPVSAPLRWQLVQRRWPALHKRVAKCSLFQTNVGYKHTSIIDGRPQSVTPSLDDEPFAGWQPDQLSQHVPFKLAERVTVSWIR